MRKSGRKLLRKPKKRKSWVGYYSNGHNEMWTTHPIRKSHIVPWKVVRCTETCQHQPHWAACTVQVIIATALKSSPSSWIVVVILRNLRRRFIKTYDRRQVLPSSGAFGFRYISAFKVRTNVIQIVLLRAQYQLSMTASLCTRCWLRSSNTPSRLLSVGLKCHASRQWQWRSKRGMASMSPESQHKV